MKHLNKILFLTVALFLVLIRTVDGQKMEDGLYMMPNTIAECSKKLYLLNTDELHCLMEKPIIPNDNFSTVSEIYLDPSTGQRTIDLQLDSVGTEILKKTTRLLKGRSIGLVVNGKLVTVLNISRTIDQGTFKCYQQGNSNEISWIRNRLIEIIEQQ